MVALANILEGVFGSILRAYLWMYLEWTATVQYSAMRSILSRLGVCNQVHFSVYLKVYNKVYLVAWLQVCFMQCNILYQVYIISCGF